MHNLIDGASYGPANELLSITGDSEGWSGETLTYNSLKQVTSVNSYIYPNPLSITYTYPTTGNNGKIISQTDNASGETVTYTYDALNRLVTAATQSTFSTPWGQSYGYDGFGNLTNVSVTQGSAPTLSATYDYNNHAGGEDANGNPGSIYLPADSGTYGATYDVENRLVATGTSTIRYSYAPGNKRVWRGVGTSNGAGQWSTSDELTFWSVNGQKLAESAVTATQGCCSGTDYYIAPQYYVTQTATNYYFGSKLIKNGNGNYFVYSDRLGSIGKFYPYGQERPTATTNGTEKFTGYFRDAESGNDYAVNRYMSPGMGRFITPDRGMGGARATDPGSWNKYAYTRGDPINRVDRHGADDDGDDGGDDSGDGAGCTGCATFYTEVDEAADVPGSPCETDPGGNECLAFISMLPGFPGFPAQVAQTQPPPQPPAQAIATAVFAAGDLLFNPNCAGLFLAPANNTLANRQQLDLQLEGLLSNGIIRQIPGGTPDVPAQTTGTGGLIYIYSGGAFFTGQVNGQPLGGWAAGLPLAAFQQIIILHEFLHYEGLVGGDTKGQTYTLPNGDKVTGSAGVSQEVLKNCF
jgi:RHS repeat-associated protein